VQGVSAWLCGNTGLFYLAMLVREPVHGMQGLLERQRYQSYRIIAENRTAVIEFQ
jgi:hypothetical protein